jgi:hypothetical protein
LGLKSSEDFGLDETNVITEYIPISVTQQFDQEMCEDFENYSNKRRN